MLLRSTLPLPFLLALDVVVSFQVLPLLLLIDLPSSLVHAGCYLKIRVIKHASETLVNRHRCLFLGLAGESRVSCLQICMLCIIIMDFIGYVTPWRQNEDPPRWRSWPLAAHRQHFSICFSFKSYIPIETMAALQRKS